MPVGSKCGFIKSGFCLNKYVETGTGQYLNQHTYVPVHSYIEFVRYVPMYVALVIIKKMNKTRSSGSTVRYCTLCNVEKKTAVFQHSFNLECQRSLFFLLGWMTIIDKYYSCWYHTTYLVRTVGENIVQNIHIYQES